MLNNPFLMFSMELDNTPELNRGRLSLLDWNTGFLGRWVATSGLGVYQKIGGWSKQGGGVMPATYQCNPAFDNYWVDVQSVDRSEVRGIEGNAFVVTPYSVTTKEGAGRSDLMIHRDANVPGSLGCIVLPDSEFKDFEEKFTTICKGHNKVKLWVQYNY